MRKIIPIYYGLLDQNNMLVTIREGQKTAVAAMNDAEYPIHGLEIRKDGGKKVFYDTETTFYKAACASGTHHQAYLMPDGKLMIT